MFETCWTSATGQFDVVLLDAARERIESLADDAHPNETGGVLVGHYTHGHRVALITEASAPPKDSAAGPSWFRRGRRGLVGWLHRLWAADDRRYYLGEWHYHPAYNADPSSEDIAQMRIIASAPSYECPEPILVIIGMQRGGSRAAHVVVVPRGAAEDHLQSKRPTSTGPT
ncbi:MAG: Mov34/MPN/PAD-1 family protein [Deltaproteobacteria bacterium]|nr:Mov34/MPN/PAD-1 family protein [Deltaproteobacteria bacterium]